jgi:uncharacterized protein (TIGR03437 family)
MGDAIPQLVRNRGDCCKISGSRKSKTEIRVQVEFQMKFSRLYGGVSLFLMAGSFAWGQSYTISTYAGGAPPPTPAPGASDSIGQPLGVAMDAAGNVYFASDNCVFKLNQSGVLTRAAGNSRPGYSGDGGPASSAQLFEPSIDAVPFGVAVDSAGNLFIADAYNNRIRKVTPAGIISTIAGNGGYGFSGDGGPAASAELNLPYGVALDGAGNLFIVDSSNNRIRKVTPAGIITTIAGNGNHGYSGDGGPAISAEINLPYGVAVDVAGNLFIADTGNQRIRKVTPAGIITTIAGNGNEGYSGDGGPAASAELYLPYGVAVDGAGNLFIADAYNNRIRKVTPAGIISTIAGNGAGGDSGDGGPATSAELGNPFGVAVDDAGNLYIADKLNSRIRKVTAAGTISTVVGNGSNYSGDGGVATSAQLGYPVGVASDSGGHLYISDNSNQRIRKVTAAGIITTIAGTGNPGYSGDGGRATSAQLNFVLGVAVDAAGNLYIADGGNSRIRKVTPAGVISTIAGNGARGYSGDGGPATNAELNTPYGVAVDGAGNLFIVDTYNNRIRKVTPAGIISTVAGNGAYGFSGNGGPAASAELNTPLGAAVDSAGNLYIADTGNSRIQKVTPAGVISTIAGNGGLVFSGDGGPATNAGIARPEGVAVDRAGNLYIADYADMRIRKVTPAGIITTIAGNGNEGYSGDGGPATSAELYFPEAVAVNAAGYVYIADAANNAIRLLKPATSATAPAVTPGGIVPACSSVNTIQPGEWISIYGTNLAGSFVSWNGTFITSLGSTSVTLDGKPAYLSYVSPVQINAQAPDDTRTGSVAVVVTTANGTASGTVTLGAYAPSFLLAADGKHVAGVIIRNDGSGAYGGGTYDILGPTGNSLGYATVAAKAGDVIELFAVGLGPTNPFVPAGQPFSGAAPVVNPVTVLINNVGVTTSFVGLSSAGLYQINMTVLQGLGTGDVPLQALAGGVHTQSGVVIPLQ